MRLFYRYNDRIKFDNTKHQHSSVTSQSRVCHCTGLVYGHILCVLFCSSYRVRIRYVTEQCTQYLISLMSNVHAIAGHICNNFILAKFDVYNFSFYCYQTSYKFSLVQLDVGQFWLEFAMLILVFFFLTHVDYKNWARYIRSKKRILLQKKDKIRVML